MRLLQSLYLGQSPQGCWEGPGSSPAPLPGRAAARGAVELLVFGPSQSLASRVSGSLGGMEDRPSACHRPRPAALRWDGRDQGTETLLCPSSPVTVVLRFHPPLSRVLMRGHPAPLVCGQKNPRDPAEFRQVWPRLTWLSICDCRQPRGTMGIWGALAEAGRE